MTRLRGHREWRDAKTGRLLAISPLLNRRRPRLLLLLLALWRSARR